MKKMIVSGWEEEKKNKIKRERERSSARIKTKGSQL